MNRRRVTLALMFALCVSGACTWLVSRTVSAHVVAGGKLVEVQYVAPVRTVQAGEALKAEDIALIAWPASDPVSGTFAKAADLVGRTALYPLGQGRPILQRDLSAPGSGPGLAGKIPDGMRAIALRSDEVVGVAGFLVPGSHVDVLVTYHTNLTPEAITATVLQDAVVIAAGSKAEPDPDGKPTAATVVTLLLSPEQAQRAVLASTQGNIHFVLRNGSDTSVSQGLPSMLSQFSGEASSPVAERTITGSAVHATSVVAHPVEGIETVLGGGSTLSAAAKDDGGTRR